MAAGSGLPQVVTGTLVGVAVAVGDAVAVAVAATVGDAVAVGAADALAEGAADALAVGEADAFELGVAEAVELAVARGLADAPAVAVGLAEVGELDTTGVAEAFAAATIGATGRPEPPEQADTKTVEPTNTSEHTRKGRDLDMETLL